MSTIPEPQRDWMELIEHRLDGVEHRLAGVEHRLDGVELTLIHHTRRFDRQAATLSHQDDVLNLLVEGQHEILRTLNEMGES